MAYQVHFEMADGQPMVLKAFARLYEAQRYASIQAPELRPRLIAIREVEDRDIKMVPDGPSDQTPN